MKFVIVNNKISPFTKLHVIRGADGSIYMVVFCIFGKQFTLATEKGLRLSVVRGFMKTDYEKLKNLLKSFGITLDNATTFGKIEKGGFKRLIINNSAGKNKVGGYPDFFVEFIFEDGEFVKVNIAE